MKNKVKHILALSLIKGVGATFIKKNMSLISSYIDNLEMLSNIGGKVTLEQLNYNLDYAQSIITDCKENNIEIVSIIDPRYPNNLKEIKDPPPILYLKGNIRLLNKAIAIIGTRKSSDLGNKIAEKVGEYFSTNWSICNGLVDGIDKHSIYSNNKILPNVIGVLSGGLNYHNTSSKVTRDLSDLVLANNGVLISENEPNKKEDQFSGSKASRIQAGVSNALILIQSKVNGGSKYTLKTFSELNRPIGIIEFSGNTQYENDELFGANRLLIEKKIEGLLEICGIKKISNIRTKNIDRISNRKDYALLSEKIKVGNNVYN
jgi:DNA processing protein|tara:strand:- start:207 stop:1160 length:954 start_codon:yes stop_codon:yes gene_type:complete